MDRKLYLVDDAGSNEPGLVAVRPLPEPRKAYTLGDGRGGIAVIYGDERLFDVAAEFSDSETDYCDDCEFPHGSCQCPDDSDEFDERFNSSLDAYRYWMEGDGMLLPEADYDESGNLAYLKNWSNDYLRGDFNYSRDFNTTLYREPATLGDRLLALGGVTWSVCFVASLLILGYSTLTGWYP